MWCMHNWNPESVGIRRNLLKLNTILKDSVCFIVEKISSYILYQSRFLQDKMPPLRWVVGEDFHTRTHCEGVEGCREIIGSTLMLLSAGNVTVPWPEGTREGRKPLELWDWVGGVEKTVWQKLGSWVVGGRWPGRNSLTVLAPSSFLLNVSPCWTQMEAKVKESPLRWSIQTSLLGYKIGWWMVESESGGDCPQHLLFQGKFHWSTKGPTFHNNNNKYWPIFLFYWEIIDIKYHFSFRGTTQWFIYTRM